MRCIGMTLLALSLGCQPAEPDQPNRKIDVEVVPHGNGGGVKVDINGKPVVDIDLKEKA